MTDKTNLDKVKDTATTGYSIFEKGTSLVANVKTIMLSAAVIAVIGAGGFALYKGSQLLNFVGNTAAAVKDVGVKGVTAVIDTTGNVVSEGMEAGSESINTVKEKVQELQVVEKTKKAGESVDKAVDGTIDWVGSKLDRWKEKTE